MVVVVIYFVICLQYSKWLFVSFIHYNSPHFIHSLIHIHLKFQEIFITFISFIFWDDYGTTSNHLQLPVRFLFVFRILYDRDSDKSLLVVVIVIIGFSSILFLYFLVKVQVLCTECILYAFSISLFMVYESITLITEQGVQQFRPQAKNLSF